MPTPANQLYGGTVADFVDSMAEEMERALNQVRAENGMPVLPMGDARDRRMLFIAIARGVINHIQKKQEAFHISNDGGSSHNHQGHTTINVRRPPNLP
jgi:hypothetical protein